MSRLYPFLVAGLPDLVPDMDAKGFRLSALKAEIDEMLAEADHEALRWMFHPADNHNLLYLLQANGTWLPFGNYTMEEMQDRMTAIEDLPAYMTVFLEGYTGKDPGRPERIRSGCPEKDLLEDFYAAAQEHTMPFVREWFVFDMELRDAVAALILRKHEAEIESGLIGEGDVPDALKSSNAADFGLKQARWWMEPLVQIMEIPNVLEREQKLDLLRWQQLDSMTEMHHFDIFNVLAFVQKALIVNRWMQWDEAAGQALFREWIAATRGALDLQQAFTMN